MPSPSRLPKSCCAVVHRSAPVLRDFWMGFDGSWDFKKDFMGYKNFMLIVIWWDIFSYQRRWIIFGRVQKCHREHDLPRFWGIFSFSAHIWDYLDLGLSYNKSLHWKYCPQLRNLVPSRATFWVCLAQWKESGKGPSLRVPGASLSPCPVSQRLSYCLWSWCASDPQSLYYVCIHIQLHVKISKYIEIDAVQR